jgi:hypothetical protein
MRLLVLTAFAVLVVALYGSTATAQEAPPDFGETDLLLMACHDALTLADDQGVPVKNCRRMSQEVNGNYASVVVRIATPIGVYHLHGRYRKSLWSGEIVSVTPGK